MQKQKCYFNRIKYLVAILSLFNAIKSNYILHALGPESLMMPCYRKV
jgi:hypothetical protein